MWSVGRQNTELEAPISTLTNHELYLDYRERIIMGAYKKTEVPFMD